MQSKSEVGNSLHVDEAWTMNWSVYIYIYI